MASQQFLMAGQTLEDGESEFTTPRKDIHILRRSAYSAGSLSQCQLITNIIIIRSPRRHSIPRECDPPLTWTIIRPLRTLFSKALITTYVPPIAIEVILYILSSLRNCQWTFSCNISAHWWATHWWYSKMIMIQWIALSTVDLLCNWAENYSKLLCFFWLSHLTLWIAHFLIKLPPSHSHHNAIGARSTLYDITMVQVLRSIWLYFPYQPASMYGYHCALETKVAISSRFAKWLSRRGLDDCVREWTDAVSK